MSRRSYRAAFDTIRHHQTPSDTIRHHQTPSDTIRHHQTPSDTIRHHQTPSDTIRHHQTPSDTIRHHQTPSDTIRHHQTPSDTIRHHQTPSDTIRHRFLDESMAAARVSPKVHRIVKAIYAVATGTVRLRLPSGETILCSEPFPHQAWRHPGRYLQPTTSLHSSCDYFVG